MQETKDLFENTFKITQSASGEIDFEFQKFTSIKVNDTYQINR